MKSGPGFPCFLSGHCRGLTPEFFDALLKFHATLTAAISNSQQSVNRDPHVPRFVLRARTWSTFTWTKKVVGEKKRNKGKSTPIRESRWLPEAGLMSSQLLSLGQRGCEQKPAEKFCLIRKLTASSIEETLSNCVPVCGKRRRRREKALICSSGPRDQELLRRSFAGKLTES